MGEPSLSSSQCACCAPPGAVHNCSDVRTGELCMVSADTGWAFKALFVLWQKVQISNVCLCNHYKQDSDKWLHLSDSNSGYEAIPATAILQCLAAPWLTTALNELVFQSNESFVSLRGWQPGRADAGDSASHVC